VEVEEGERRPPNTAQDHLTHGMAAGPRLGSADGVPPRHVRGIEGHRGHVDAVAPFPPGVDPTREPAPTEVRLECEGLAAANAMRSCVSRHRQVVQRSRAARQRSCARLSKENRPWGLDSTCGSCYGLTEGVRGGRLSMTGGEQVADRTLMRSSDGRVMARLGDRWPDVPSKRYLEPDRDWAMRRSDSRASRTTSRAPNLAHFERFPTPDAGVRTARSEKSLRCDVQTALAGLVTAG
jgi:hypothetical protein